MGSELGSFAHHTITVRLPDIARRVIKENQFSNQINQRIESLIDDIVHPTIRFLNDQGAPDETLWNLAVQPYQGKSWLDVPWFFSETYFYRRILEATGFFQESEGGGVDPFLYQKRKGLETPTADILQLCQQINHLVDHPLPAIDMISKLLLVDLWANQVDLSLWPVDQANRPDHADPGNALGYILVDDRERIAAYFSSLGDPFDQRRVVDLLIDNAGFELVCDCCLADALLTTGQVGQVRFHLKIHPTFVSDAMIKDVQETIIYLVSYPDGEISRVGERLSRMLAENRLVLVDHPFWTSAKEMWELPAELEEVLGSSSLVISKGDANYRRLLGDRHWKDTDDFSQITRYFIPPLAVLRSLKSDVLAGLQFGQSQELDEKDAKWRTDGRWGIIQAKLSIDN